MASPLFAAMAKAFPMIEGALKDSENPAFKQGNKAIKYADLSSVVTAIKPALTANEMFFTQSTHEQQGGVCVETQVHHSSGESMSFGKLFVPAGKQDAQGYGSALTYARRYSLMTAFGVCPEDDDGNAAVAAPKDPLYPAAEDATPRPKPLTGKHKTRESLKQAAANIATALREAADGGDHIYIDEVLTEWFEDIEQIKSEGPKAWMDNKDWGLNAIIAEARATVDGKANA